MNAPQLKHRINLLRDRTVVTGDGEYLGTWDTDETDALYLFFPDGATEDLFCEPFMRNLCDRIDDWHARLQERD